MGHSRNKRGSRTARRCARIALQLEAPTRDRAITCLAQGACSEPTRPSGRKPRASVMVAALRTACRASIPHSQLCGELGTRPADAEHLVFKDAERAFADYAQSHAARADDPKYHKRTWMKANPSLGHDCPILESAIARVRRAAARRDPIPTRIVRSGCRLNLGMSDVEVSATLGCVHVDGRIEGEAGRAGACTWGIDLGTNAAQSAVRVPFWPETGRLDSSGGVPV